MNCRVSLWSTWGACNARCGQTGYQTRTRRILTKPSCNGVACPSLSERKTCRGPCCRVNCVVSPWGSWSKCNAPSGKCGTNSGKRTRTRAVRTPSSCGGTKCPNLYEVAPCTPVKVNCQVFYYIDADEMLGLLLLPRKHIFFIARSEDMIFIFHMWGYWCRHGY